MRYRPHKGSLAESLALTVEVNGRDGLLDHIRKELAPWPSAPPHDWKHITIQPYYGDDDRIGWKDVHIITLDGYGVLGFCEGPAK